jgi:phage terminase large subunit-like protein
MEASYRGTTTAKQELYGEMLTDPPGALFTRPIIERWRCTEAEARGEDGFERVVVGVDPPAGAGEQAAACGIVCAGLRRGVTYVLQDASVRGMRPLEWAGRVVAVARRWGAGVIAAEANQGGEMVRELLHMAGAKEGARVVLVHAKQSKFDRAQPLSGRYDVGEVRHAGVMRELEDEMCAFGAGATGLSPDRLDALVWAVRELSVRKVKPKAEWM